MLLSVQKQYHLVFNFDYYVMLRVNLCDFLSILSSDIHIPPLNHIHYAFHSVDTGIGTV